MEDRLNIKRIGSALLLGGVFALSGGFLVTLEENRDPRPEPAYAALISYPTWSPSTIGAITSTPAVAPPEVPPPAAPLQTTDEAPAADIAPTATPVSIQASGQPQPTATSAPPTAVPPTPVPPTAIPPTAVPPTPLPPKPTATAPAPPSAPVSLTSQEQQLFNLHLTERTSAGIAGLSLDATLVNVARQRAQDMATNNYFSHTSPSGVTAFSLLNSAGYAYGIAGENIARNNYPDAQAANVAMTGFMNSPSHRENVLESRFRRVGIGVAFAADGMKYFAVVFSD